jgi:hypothetical protein
MPPIADTLVQEKRTPRHVITEYGDGVNKVRQDDDEL